MIFTSGKFSSNDFNTKMRVWIALSSGGTFELSSWAGLSAPGIDFLIAGNSSTAAVYPNPARHKIEVGFKLEESNRVDINIYDLYGKACYQSQLEGVKGMNQHAIDLIELQPGTYNVMISTANERIIKKFIKV